VRASIRSSIESSIYRLGEAFETTDKRTGLIIGWFSVGEVAKIAKATSFETFLDYISHYIYKRTLAPNRALFPQCK
jgi:hypothetical protein